MKRPTPKKMTKPRPWTKEDVRLLKTLVREKTKTTVIARKLKRTEGATRLKARALGVKLVGTLQRKRKPAAKQPASGKSGDSSLP